MRKDKKLNNSNSSSKLKVLRIGKICALIMFLGFINYACDKEDSHEYFIKYKINSSTLISGGELNVAINSENNEKMTFIINQNTKWEMTIGPVSKGFKAEILGTNRSGTAELQVYTEIQVSENDSPFVTKAIDGFSGGSIGTSVISMVSKYTVD